MILPVHGFFRPDQPWSVAGIEVIGEVRETEARSAFVLQNHEAVVNGRALGYEEGEEAERGAESAEFENLRETRQPAAKFSGPKSRPERDRDVEEKIHHGLP